MVADIQYDEFVCPKSLFYQKDRVAIGLLLIITVLFISGLSLFLYKVRRKAFPCWFGKPGKYIALYNANDNDGDDGITINGENRAKTIVKNRGGLPAPVAV